MPRQRSLTAALIAICAAGCGSSAPSSVTVHGRILAPGIATAIPSVSVQVGSVRTASDADGKFVAEGVHVPYDLVVSSQFGVGSVSVYKGVTRVDPVVPFPFLGIPDWPQQGTLSLTLTGLGAADVATAGWAGDAPSGGGAFGSASSPFVTGISWAGPETTRGTVRVLTYSTDSGEVSGRPISYVGFGSLTTTVSSTQAGGGTLALSAIPTVSLTGTMELPDSYVPQYRALEIVFPDGATLGLAPPDLGLTFTNLVPVLPDSSIHIEVNAVSDSGMGAGAVGAYWTGPPSASPVLRFVQPPSLLNPPDGAHVPADVELSWADTSAGASMVQVACFSPDNPYAPLLLMAVVTSETSVRLPDLGALGVGFPPGGDCDWGVFRSSSQEDVDSYLVEHYHYLPLPEYSAAPSVQTTRSSRPRRFFPN